MNFEILLIQGAGRVSTEQEQIIVASLKAELGEGFSIIYPHMPDADNPSYETWDAVLTASLRPLSGKVILLGHSLGGSIILKHFSKAPVPDNVIGMILFGVPYWKDQNWDVSEYVIGDEFLDNLSKLDNLYFYYSTDDEVIPNNQFESYQKLMPQAHFRILSNVDHSYLKAIPSIAMDIMDLTIKAKG